MNCPLCNNRCQELNNLYLLNLIDSTTYRCASCGLLFRQPLPNKESLSRYYASRYYRHPDKIELEMARIQGDWLTKMLKKSACDLSKLSYIEFGAGRGWLVSYMKRQKVASAIGYEPDNQSVEWGKNEFKIDLRQGFIEDALCDEKSKKGNVLISLVHVLEHLHRPCEVLEKIASFYEKPYLYLEVPDALWEGPVMELDNFSQSSMGQHFWSFTEESLNLLLKRSGYSVIACQKDGIPNFWDNHLYALELWRTISSHHKNWQCNQFSLKKEIVDSLNIAGKCFLAAIKMRLRSLQKRNLNRLNLPIIRVFAQTIK